MPTNEATVEFEELSESEILRLHYANGGRWLSASALARRWGCHRSKIYRLLAEKGLCFLRLGEGRGSIRLSSFWVAEFERKNLNRL